MWYVVCLIVGAVIGALLVCCCIVAGDADKRGQRMETLLKAFIFMAFLAFAEMIVIMGAFAWDLIMR